MSIVSDYILQNGQIGDTAIFKLKDPYLGKDICLKFYTRILGFARDRGYRSIVYRCLR